MVFPIRAANLRVDDSFDEPSWCRFEGSNIELFAPLDGYVYLIQATPMWVSDEREWLLVFVPFNSEKEIFSQHSTWHAPIPSCQIFRFSALQNPLNFLISFFRNLSQDNVRSISRSSLRLGIEDRALRMSIPREILLVEPNITGSAASILSDWSDNSSLVVPVSKNQKIYSGISSIETAILFVQFRGGTLVGNIFSSDKHTYWFDTLLYLKRCAYGGLFSSIPNSSDPSLPSSLNWNKETLIDLCWSFDPNQPRYLKIYLVFGGRSSHENSIVLKGGAQEVELIIPYRENLGANGRGRLLISPDVFSIFNDFYSDNIASGHSERYFSIVFSLEIRGNEVPREPVPGESNSGHFLQVGDVYFNNLQGLINNNTPGQESVFRIGLMALRVKTYYDPYTKIEYLLNRIVPKIGELLELASGTVTVPAGGQSISSSSILRLNNLVRSIVDSNSYMRRYDSLFSSNTSTGRLAISYTEKSNELDELINQLVVEINHSLTNYLTIFRKNEKRLFLLNIAGDIYIQFESVLPEINRGANNLFSEHNRPAGGFDYSLIRRAFNPTSSLYRQIIKYNASQIVCNALDNLRTRLGTGVDSLTLSQYNEILSPNFAFFYDDSRRRINVRDIRSEDFRATANILRDIINVILGVLKLIEDLPRDGQTSLFNALSTGIDFSSLLVSVSQHSWFWNNIYDIERISVSDSNAISETTYQRFSDFTKFLSIAGLVIKIVKSIYEEYRVSERYRIDFSGWIAVGIFGSTLGTMASVLSVNPPVAISLIVASLIVTGISSYALDRRFSTQIVYLPSFRHFITFSYLGNESESNLAEWRDNVNLQISMAYSYIYPITKRTSSEQGNNQSDEPRATYFFGLLATGEITEERISISFKFPFLGTESFVLLIFMKIDGMQPLQELIKINLSDSESSSIIVNNTIHDSVIGRTSINDGKILINSLEKHNEKYAEIVMSLERHSEVGDLRHINQIRIITSIEQIEAYYEGEQITPHRLYYHPMTSRRDVVVNQLIPE